MFKNKSFLIRFICVLFVVLAPVSVFGVYQYRYAVDFPMQDIEYKKAIIRQSQNPFYRLENLKNLVGEEELTELIKANNDNPEIYTPSEENKKNGVYRITLHMHTTNSDGQSTIEHYLDQTEKYAEESIKDGGYFYIAITDHNTVLGAKELVDVLQKNPDKYPRVKVIAGIEINSKLYSTTVAKDPVEIHTLVWCINPYDKYLNRVFYKKDLNDKWNIPVNEPDFEGLVNNMSHYGIPGIAHPATYSAYLGKDRNDHITELFDKYKAATKKIPFAEGFYQTYPAEYYEPGNEYNDYYMFIKKTAEEKGIIRTGSMDTHGLSIFYRL